MNASIRKLGSADFARLFGVTEAGVARQASLIATQDFSYTPLDDAETAALSATIDDRLNRQDFTEVGAHRAGIWEDAWSETLERFEKSGYDRAMLNPKFMGAAPVVRLEGHFVRATSPGFELHFFEVFRDWLFRTWLADIDSFWEFGAGSCFNLAAHAALYPDRPITGLDWSASSVRIAELLHSQLGLKIEGRRFDFFVPDTSLSLNGGAGVATFCALEQTGQRFEPFIEFIRTKKPKRVVHMEPTPELYDTNDPTDRLALQYHNDRRYLTGLLPYLKSLDSAGQIKLLAAKRLGFGSQYHECFTLMVWEPR